MPHLLIAGVTGSGKSTCLGTIVTSLLMRTTPDQVQMLMIDTKRIELPIYNGIPHLIKNVLGDPKLGSGALYEMTREMDSRFERFSKVGTRTLEEYNSKFPKEKIPSIVILVEELHDLIFASPRAEAILSRIAQGGRSAGVHLVLTTQRVSSDILTKSLKENIPSRIAFAVPAPADFRKVLDIGVTDRLRGNGEMFFLPFGALAPVRAQGALVSSAQTGLLVDFWRRQSHTENMLDVEFVKVETARVGLRDGQIDALLYEAAISVIETQLGSTAQLQKNFSIGHPRAVRIMMQLEIFGVVGPNQGTRPRQILMNFSDLELIAGRLGRSDQYDMFASGD